MRKSGQVLTGHRVRIMAPWVKSQDLYNCYFWMTDLHALTSNYEHTNRIQRNTIENVNDSQVLHKNSAPGEHIVNHRGLAAIGKHGIIHTS